MRRKLLACLAVVLVTAWAWIALRPGPERELADLIAELRARGEPVSLAEFDAPLPPDARNGAPDLDAAMVWFEANQPEGDWESDVAGPWNATLPAPWQETATPEQRAALVDLLLRLAPMHERIDRAAERPEIAWPLPPRDTAAGVLALGLPVPMLQDLTRHLTARALGGASSDERLRALRSGLAIPARLRVRTTLDHLVAVEAFRAACENLRDGLARAALDPGAARHALDDVLVDGWDARFPGLVRGERAYLLDAWPFFLDGTLQSELARSLGPPPGAWSRFEQALKTLLRGRSPFGGELFEDLELEDLRALGSYLDPALDAETLWRSQAGDAPSSPFSVVLVRVRLQLVRGDMSARMARLALAAYEHRRLHGAWPASPRDLLRLFDGGVPPDPFTGDPFVLERDGDALVIRARPWEGVREQQDPDHVWRLPPR